MSVLRPCIPIRGTRSSPKADGYIPVKAPPNAMKATPVVSIMKPPPKQAPTAIRQALVGPPMSMPAPLPAQRTWVPQVPIVKPRPEDYERVMRNSDAHTCAETRLFSTHCHKLSE